MEKRGAFVFNELVTKTRKEKNMKYVKALAVLLFYPYFAKK